MQDFSCFSVLTILTILTDTEHLPYSIVYFHLVILDIQAAIPLGQHNESSVSISLVASHGNDKFLLDSVLDMYSCLQEEASIITSSSPLPDTNCDMDTAELLKEKVHFKSYKNSHEFLKLLLNCSCDLVRDRERVVLYHAHQTIMLSVLISYLS